MNPFLTSVALLLGFGVAHGDAAQRPVTFVANRGEAPAVVRFVGNSASVVARFGDNGMSMGATGEPVMVDFVGASEESAVGPSGDILRYRNTWPGIEIEYAAYQQTLKSEYHVAAGA